MTHPLILRRGGVRGDSTAAEIGEGVNMRQIHFGRHGLSHGAVLLAVVLLVVAFGAGGASSANTAVGVPYNLVIPNIPGTAQVGTTLTADAGTWTQPATYTYQWYRCSPENLIANSGFENDTSGWAAISNGNKPTTISRVSTTVHSGAWALQVNLANTSFDGVEYTPHVPIDPNQTYHFSAWVWVPGASRYQDSYAERLNLETQAYDAAGNTLSFPPNTTDFSGSGNSFIGPGWTQVSNVTQSPIHPNAAAEQLEILNYMANNETIYLDDVWFNACDTIQARRARATRRLSSTRTTSSWCRSSRRIRRDRVEGSQTKRPSCRTAKPEHPTAISLPRQETTARRTLLPRSQ